MVITLRFFSYTYSKNLILNKIQYYFFTYYHNNLIFYFYKISITIKYLFYSHHLKPANSCVEFAAIYQ